MNVLLSILSTTFICTVNVQATCVDSGSAPVTDVSATLTFQEGTIESGFKLKCQYEYTGGYTLFLWRIQKFNKITTSYDPIYTFIPSSDPSEFVGANFANRNLTLQSNNTVVFPTMIPEDVGNNTFQCTVQFNTATITCTDVTVKTQEAIPVNVTIVASINGIQLNALPPNTPVLLSVTANDLLTLNMSFTVFSLSIDGNDTCCPLTTDINVLPNGFMKLEGNTSYDTPKFPTQIKIPVELVIEVASSRRNCSDCKKDLLFEPESTESNRSNNVVIPATFGSIGGAFVITSAAIIGYVAKKKSKKKPCTMQSSDQETGCVEEQRL